MKVADRLLETYPTHPEINAMKALLLHGMNKQNEAYAQIKTILFKNLTNYTCWNVYGILSRQNKDFDQARRAFLNALKYKPGEESVMRDLACLQIHLRDYAGFQETRRQMLMAAPGQNNNWVVYAEASMLNKQYKTVLECVTSIFKFDKESDDKRKMKPNEVSEVCLLAVRAYEGAEDYQGALKFIKKNRKKILDQVALSDIEARLFLKYGYPERALEQYEILLQLNSANFDTYLKILKTKGIDIKEGEKLSEEDQKKVDEILQEYIKGFPKVSAHIRVGLKLLHGDLFESYLRKYVKPLVIKGAPSVMSDLKEFYDDADKVARIGNLLNGYLENLEKDMILEAGDEEEQNPTVHLWTLYHVAHHYAFQRDLKKAFEYVDKAIEHTPTLLELYTFKGKVYEMSGDSAKAAELFEYARTLDLADRAINAHAAEYMCKNNEVERGENTMKLFTDDCGYDVNYHDNQTIWFEMRCGFAHYRLGEYRKSLKQLNFVERHIENMITEQYDYYYYSIRKFALKAFEELMEMFDHRVYQNGFVQKSALGYLKLQAKIDKIKDTEKVRYQEEYDTYIKSEEYAQVQKDIAKQEDDDEYRNDQDPKGYTIYHKILNDKWSVVPFVEKVVKNNPKNALLLAKAIPVFANHGALKQAIEAAEVLVSRHASYPRTTSALVKLFTKWNSMDEAAREKAVGKNELAAFTERLNKLGLTSDVQKYESTQFTVEKSYPKASALDYVHEHIKLAKFFGKDLPDAEAIATKALTESAQKDLRVKVVVQTHKTLKKVSGFKDASFSAKAKELFPLASYFK